MAPKDVNTYLSQNQNAADKELAAEWAQLEELYNKRYFLFVKYFILDVCSNRKKFI